MIARGRDHLTCPRASRRTAASKVKGQRTISAIRDLWTDPFGLREVTETTATYRQRSSVLPFLPRTLPERGDKPAPDSAAHPTKQSTIDLVPAGNSACHRGVLLFVEVSILSLAAANVSLTAATVQPIRRAILRVENPVAFHTQIRRSSSDSDSRMLRGFRWPVSRTSPVDQPSVEVPPLGAAVCCRSALGADPACFRRVTNRSKRFQEIRT
jgi:hypothetical protein